MGRKEVEKRGLIRKLKNENTAAAVRLGMFKSRKDGMSEFMAVLIIILIAVIVGAALLAIMKTAMPDLFQDIIDKIKDVFDV